MSKLHLRALTVRSAEKWFCHGFSDRTFCCLKGSSGKTALSFWLILLVWLVFIYILVLLSRSSNLFQLRFDVFMLQSAIQEIHLHIWLIRCHKTLENIHTEDVKVLVDCDLCDQSGAEQLKSSKPPPWKKVTHLNHVKICQILSEIPVWLLINLLLLHSCTSWNFKASPSYPLSNLHQRAPTTSLFPVDSPIEHLPPLAWD